jgi:hypothetical protein
VDHRADIYSLGVVFYEMLTGELPLGRFQPPSHKVEMDVRLDEVVLHALEKEPSRRYQQASQVQTAVETIAGGTAPAASVASAPPDHHPKRKELAGALAVSAFALCLTCFAMFLGIEKKSGLLVLSAVCPLLLLIDAWNEILKKTAVQAIANGTAPPIAAAQSFPAPAADPFWRRFAGKVALVCFGMLLLSVGALVIPQLFRTGFRAVQRAERVLPALAPVPAGGTEKEAAQLVIDTSKKSYGGGRSDLRAFWPFTCLVPAGHLAQVVFVLWTNGVATIKPDFSGYVKVGEKPVVLENILFSSNTNTTGARGTNVAQWCAVYTDFNHEAIGLISNQPSCRKLETAPRSVLHSGHQLAIRLAEFIQPAGLASNGWSGVELRLILQPLSSPAVQTDPNEVVGADYVGGFGLAGASEDSIIKLIKDLPMDPQAAEKSP